MRRSGSSRRPPPGSSARRGAASPRASGARPDGAPSLRRAITVVSASTTRTPSATRRRRRNTAAEGWVTAPAIPVPLAPQPEAAVEQLARLAAGIARVEEDDPEPHLPAARARDQAAAGGHRVARLDPGHSAITLLEQRVVVVEVDPPALDRERQHRLAPAHDPGQPRLPQHRAHKRREVRRA